MGIPSVGGRPLTPLMSRGRPSVAAWQPVMPIKASLGKAGCYRRLKGPADN